MSRAVHVRAETASPICQQGDGQGRALYFKCKETVEQIGSEQASGRHGRVMAEHSRSDLITTEQNMTDKMRHGRAEQCGLGQGRAESSLAKASRQMHIRAQHCLVRQKF